MCFLSDVRLITNVLWKVIGVRRGGIIILFFYCSVTELCDALLSFHLVLGKCSLNLEKMEGYVKLQVSIIVLRKHPYIPTLLRYLSRNIGRRFVSSVNFLPLYHTMCPHIHLTLPHHKLLSKPEERSCKMCYLKDKYFGSQGSAISKHH